MVGQQFIACCATHSVVQGHGLGASERPAERRFAMRGVAAASALPDDVARLTVEDRRTRQRADS